MFRKDSFDFSRSDDLTGSKDAARDGDTKDAHDFPDFPSESPDGALTAGGCTPDEPETVDVFDFKLTGETDGSEYAGSNGLPPKIPDDIWADFPNPWGPDADFPEPGPLPPPPPPPPPPPADSVTPDYEMDVFMSV